MKQIKVTDQLKEKITAAVGAEVDISNFAVFSSTAINTLPVRKNHPVYKGGVHQRSFLEQMASALKAESLPLQIMHDSSVIPSGRVFDAEVVDFGTHSELHTLFWIDKSNDEGVKYANLVNNGTIDQVSVSVMPKEAVSNKTGFNFLGEDASVDNIWSGTDDKGNIMGKDGAHVMMHNLDSWFEMSLVGQGGIKGAKIHASGDMKLAASGQTVPAMTLNLSLNDKDEDTMDLTQLVTELTDTKVKLASAQEKATTAEANIVTLTEQLTATRAELEALKGTTAPTQEQLDAANAETVAVKDQLKAVYSHIAAITGNVSGVPDEDMTKLVADIKTDIQKIRGTGFTAVLDASNGTGDTLRTGNHNNAFKRSK